MMASLDSQGGAKKAMKIVMKKIAAMCREDPRHNAAEPRSQETTSQRQRSLCRPEADAERFGVVFRASPEPIFLIDPQRMALLDANPAACAALNYAPSQLAGRDIREIASQSCREAVVEELAALSDLRNSTAAFDAIMRSSDGMECPARWHLHATQTAEGPLVVLFVREQDPSHHEELQETLLLTDLGHDPLTRLPNRRLFERRLQRALKSARRRPGYAFAVLFIDLDGFKAVNDTLGHVTGDYVLREVARRLARCIRPNDVIARVGGDEFTVLIDDVGEDDAAVRAACRIQGYTELPLNLDGQTMAITASIGIARSSSGYDRPETILRDADRAMYVAKTLGKSPHVFETNCADHHTTTRADA